MDMCVPLYIIVLYAILPAAKNDSSRQNMRKNIFIQFTCEHTFACLNNRIIPTHIHAQVYHKEHGYIHDDTLHQQRQLEALGEPAKYNEII